MKMMKNMWNKNVVNFILDWRVFVPILFWFGLIFLERVFGLDRSMLEWSENVLLLVLMGFSVFLISGPITDHLFQDEETWEEAWDKGNALPVSLIFLGRFIFSAIIAGQIINPF